LKINQIIAMKKVLLTAALFIIVFIAKSQGVDSAFAIVHYTLTHVNDTTQPENPVKQNFALFLGETVSNYKYDYTNMSAGSLSSISVSGGTITARPVPSTGSGELSKYSYSSNYFKSSASGKLTYLTIPAYSDKLFGVEETLNDINWTITQETKQIMGMDCQKATGRFKGRDYEAWFSTQLPYSNGPWKLGGLPGLIVEAADTKKEVVFKMTAFENVTGPKTALRIPDYVIKTSPKEYKQYAEALKRDAAANTGAAGAGGGAMLTVKGTLIGGSSGNINPRQFNNPIEKE
jgi:GLPGLI family protein